MSIRIPTHRITVFTGLTEKKAVVMPPTPEMASYRLNRPNTMPSTMPATGPMHTAPTAMGSVRKLMFSGPTGTLPSPSSRMATSMATSNARRTHT